MSPIQSWGLVIVVVAIAFILRDGIRKSRRAKIADAQSRRAYGPSAIFGRIEVAYGRQCGHGWVQPEGPGVIRSAPLIQALARSGYWGHFWRIREYQAANQPINPSTSQPIGEGLILAERRSLACQL